MVVNRLPLTPEQQSLVLSCDEWLEEEIRRVPPRIVIVFSRKVVVQEAWLGATKAAADFNPEKYPGVRFGAFARTGVRRHLMGFYQTIAERAGMWRQWPEPDDEDDDFEVPDYRTGDVWPAFRAWCSEEYRDQRRCLDWRSRVVLYLRLVEGWLMKEVGDVFGICKQSVFQIEVNAVAKLAHYRRLSSQTWTAVPDAAGDGGRAEGLGVAGTG